jgi:sirohydrochlorin cobaltochelatase
MGIMNPMSDAIILFSHGSVLCGAGQNLAELAVRLRERGIAPIAEVGYLNYSEPRFIDTFRRCVEQGATHITVVPYFLVAGKFVKEDLPDVIARAQAEFPGVEVQVADAIRFHPLLAEALLACANRARPPAEWRDTKAQVAAFCRANPRCPLYGTQDCPATQAVEVV